MEGLITQVPFATPTPFAFGQAIWDKESSGVSSDQNFSMASTMAKVMCVSELPGKTLCLLFNGKLLDFPPFALPESPSEPWEWKRQ